VLALDVAGLFQALTEVDQAGVLLSRIAAEPPDHRQRGLLRARRERQRDGRASDERGKLAPPHGAYPPRPRIADHAKQGGPALPRKTGPSYASWVIRVGSRSSRHSVYVRFPVASAAHPASSRASCALLSITESARYIRIGPWRRFACRTCG